MATPLAIAALLVVGAALLFGALASLAAIWRYLPLSQRASELLFTVLALVFCTPVPVSVGIGAMYYPIVMLYGNIVQLKWHIGWYARAPELVVPSVFLTVALAYLLSHRLLPNRSKRAKSSVPARVCA